MELAIQNEIGNCLRRIATLRQKEKRAHKTDRLIRIYKTEANRTS